MRFHYVATDAKNQISEGDFEAQNPGEVLEWMGRQGLRPVSVKSLGGTEASGLKGIFSQAISVDDKVFLTKYLALMLKVGTDLFRAIDILIADFEKPAVKSLLTEVKDALGKGQPFYTTFQKYPKYFSPVFINLVKAGEISGNLDKVFDDLSKTLEREQDLSNRIHGALIYPIVLVVLSLTILFLMVTFALPKIAETFLSAGINPPLFSKIVFTVGLFLGAKVLYIVLILAATIFSSWYFFSRTVLGKSVLGEIFNRLPVINGVLHRIALQRFAATFASLLKSGMPIIEAIETTASVAGSLELETALRRIAEDVTKGLTVGEAFRKEPFFPRVVVNLIAISEKAGHLDNILDTLAEFYESEIDASIKILVSFLEPILLLIIGMIVGTIALSIILPVYQLVGKI